ncbi:hypothetical protein [Aquimonas voraii]|uniref:hypothetical protein n=1 Tax=Aquimonas voraii TaxID=265719 RepID=UPI00115FB156|nr:hypothetical protein [Aquimonas voraii]
MAEADAAADDIASARARLAEAEPALRAALHPRRPTLAKLDAPSERLAFQADSAGWFCSLAVSEQGQSGACRDGSGLSQVFRSTGSPCSLLHCMVTVLQEGVITPLPKSDSAVIESAFLGTADGSAPIRWGSGAEEPLGIADSQRLRSRVFGLSLPNETFAPGAGARRFWMSPKRSAWKPADGDPARTKSRGLEEGSVAWRSGCPEVA